MLTSRMPIHARAVSWARAHRERRRAGAGSFRFLAPLHTSRMPLQAQAASWGLGYHDRRPAITYAELLVISIILSRAGAAHLPPCIPLYTLVLCRLVYISRGCLLQARAASRGAWATTTGERRRAASPACSPPCTPWLFAALCIHLMHTLYRREQPAGLGRPATGAWRRVIRPLVYLGALPPLHSRRRRPARSGRPRAAHGAVPRRRPRLRACQRPRSGAAP